MNFEDYEFYNPELIKNIVDTLKIFIEKIILSELERIDYDITKSYGSYTLFSFLSFGPKEFQKYEFKLVKDRALKIIKEFDKTSGLKELSDLKFIEFVFLYEFINIEEKTIRDIVFEFFENYSDKILRFDYNAKEYEFFIVLGFSIMNIVEKTDMDENFKKKYLEKLYKLLSFDTEIQEFIEKKDFRRKKLEKLSIIKFIKYIKNSKLEILGILEKFYKDKFKTLMINFIDNFKYLHKFYIKFNLKFWNTAYYDFIRIFCNKKEIIFSNNYIPLMYWKLTVIRNEIYNYLEAVFSFNNIDIENELESKRKKQRLE